MDPELFKKKLEEFAELKQLKTPKSAAFRENDQPETIFRNGNEFDVEADNNPTLNWVIKKLKPHVAVCQDCHQVVENRQVDSKLYEIPQAHWRSHCRPCGMVRNPYTKQFDLTVKKSMHHYACWLKGMPEPEPYNIDHKEEKSSHLTPVYKKPTK